jgi:type IV secretory pathway VirB3-like protein
MARIVDTLFVACTRPAMKLGVPYDAYYFNVGLTTLITTFVIRRPPGFAIGILVHFVLRELCRHDPHFFRKYKLWMNTKARSTTGVVWGGSRLQPSPNRIRKSSEVRSSV